ncbi:uncharacterized protein LOC126965853 [Leptidea sinapis]|uniref:uncharacterized protein LOC126965853 n=1 Tax=Leptidea sinapis TaxID=189913 RepID=UPI0021C405F6|nr:uncharacterized protein LOC126965853 [Leptidea sinapis]
MDLPDCPPGAEGYEDTVVSRPMKPVVEDKLKETKAETEFLEHLGCLKLRVEDGSMRPMVERRARDVGGQWSYYCFPCAAACSGETVLQSHMAGKKHKSRLATTNIWPKSIFTEQPRVAPEKRPQSTQPPTTTTKGIEKVTSNNAADRNNTEFDNEVLEKYRNIRCLIQDSLDEVTAPLLGLEYLIEHPPEEEHHEPSYLCGLCCKQGHPRTIINHLTCFWHRLNYVTRHFPKAGKLISEQRGNKIKKPGLGFVVHRLAQCIENKYGRLEPLHIMKHEFEANKEKIVQTIGKGKHFSEKEGCTFEEVIDIDLINSLNSPDEGRDPSPPVVAAPTKPFKLAKRSERQRQISIDSLSDISDSLDTKKIVDTDKRVVKRGRSPTRHEPYPDRRREATHNRPFENPKPAAPAHRSSPEKNITRTSRVAAPSSLTAQAPADPLTEPCQSSQPPLVPGPRQSAVGPRPSGARAQCRRPQPVARARTCARVRSLHADCTHI